MAPLVTARRSEAKPSEARARARWAAALTAGVALCAAAGARAGPYAEGGYAPSLMQAWATGVAAFHRGPIDIADPGLGDASYGAPENALGAPPDDVTHVYSHGDGGTLTLSIASRIGDGPGDDFAVFENGFYAPGGFFGEFAFVEVSSNGTDFARFPSACLRTTPVPDGGVVDPTDYHNLAGKHPRLSGTGFDLAELAQDPLVAQGKLDLARVSHVRLVDVIGNGSTTDASGRPVYDPYPTRYPSSGFDAQAVGVLHVPEPDFAASFAAGAVAIVFLRRRPCARRR
ncbi:MAG TPA: PEP-CTERM sorting domain-containing protein [Myxococcota bacterium]|nr:PEP-CTERM sorting domain-containing protein [Myxococcota bacterium]